ncbi:MAG TPA: dihydropteroate synthase [Bacteroidales bacterium]|nr:dihydropteroate synthase [Bacteroidales bacterium]HRX95979.1 dihydropteroate synthase [Bacteroidales bacterium]
MGILNITPDSFYDGGSLKTDTDILFRVEKMLSEGAAIIDIGAISTRPGANEVSESEELNRLTPVIDLISKKIPGTILSIDTYRSNIAKRAIETGAHIINDISGGNLDPKMFETIATLKVPYIMMHMQGTPATMQQNPQYTDVVADILDFFKVQINKLKSLGVTDNIVLDPGFGFGKTVEHNFQILKSLQRFSETGFPVLAGLSRKSMVNKIIGTMPENALNGTTALNVLALLNGASILRVHDVKEAVQAIKLVNFYKSV